MRTIKNSDFLCFQVLLSFVPTVFHFWKMPAFSRSLRNAVFSCSRAVPALAYDNLSTT